MTRQFSRFQSWTKFKVLHMTIGFILIILILILIILMTIGFILIKLYYMGDLHLQLPITDLHLEFGTGKTKKN